MYDFETEKYPNTTPSPTATNTLLPPNNLNFIAEVVQEVGTAVVRINATCTVDVPGAFATSFS